MGHFHLDTNALIALADPSLPLFQISAQLIEAGELPDTSAIAWHEFVRGPLSEQDKARAYNVIGARILPVSQQTAEKAADPFRNTGSRRASTADCLIASAAILSGAVLLTGNHDDFSKFEPYGLKMVPLGLRN